MPKTKTHSGTKKRVRVTGSGKLRRERSGRRHYMQKQSNRVRRRLEGTTEVAAQDVPRLNKMLGR